MSVTNLIGLHQVLAGVITWCIGSLRIAEYAETCRREKRLLLYKLYVHLVGLVKGSMYLAIYNIFVLRNSVSVSVSVISTRPSMSFYQCSILMASIVDVVLPAFCQ